ncbi:MAG: Lrp/AsnC ligand binding domain-containing protein [Candidatus Methanofastidiosia archaeon]
MNHGDKLVIAFVLCVCDAGKERQVVEKLKAMEQVEEAFVVYGEYDVIAKVNVKELKQLDTFVTEKVRRMKDIQMTSTMITI